MMFLFFSKVYVVMRNEELNSGKKKVFWNNEEGRNANSFDSFTYVQQQQEIEIPLH